MGHLVGLHVSYINLHPHQSVFGLNVRITSTTEFVEHIKFYDGAKPAKLGRGFSKACAKKLGSPIRVVLLGGTELKQNTRIYNKKKLLSGIRRDVKGHRLRRAAAIATTGKVKKNCLNSHGR